MFRYFIYCRHAKGRPVQGHEVEAKPGLALETVVKAMNQMIVEFNESLVFEFGPGLG